MRTRVLVSAVSIALIVAACGGGGGGSSPQPEPVAPIFYLKASDAQPGDRFGTSVAVDRVGGRIAVGAPVAKGLNDASGKVYVFDWSGDAWNETGQVVSQDFGAFLGAFELFGDAVALSDDGTTLAVGAPWAIPVDPADVPFMGSVYVYTHDGLGWTFQEQLQDTFTGTIQDRLGETVALSGAGDALAVGAPGYDGLVDDVGAVKTYTRAGGAWTEGSALTAVAGALDDFAQGDRFGHSVALSGDGRVLVVGAPNEDGGPGDPTPDGGAIYTFLWDGTLWNPGPVMRGSASGDHYGSSLVLAYDGSMLAVGAPDASTGTTVGDGTVYVYSWDGVGSQWLLDVQLAGTVPDDGDRFGSAVAVTGPTAAMLAVGAEREDSGATGLNGDPNDDSAADAGAAFTGTETTAGLVVGDYYKAPNSGAGDLFGGAVAISFGGETLVVGARGEGGDANSRGDAFNDLAPGAGAVYVY